MAGFWRLAPGTGCVWPSRMPDIYRIDDLVAWQLANEIKEGVFELLARTPAGKDWKFAGQVGDAASSIASNISEGFYRYNPAEFANFLRYARASVAEVLTRLPDGVKRGYYEQPDIDALMALLSREAAVIGGLRDSMRRLAKQRKAKKT
jgi:four helix bundle protein